ncbi:MAG: hypothetical protein KGV44_09445 [Flavobacteriaceae bacterium]|nr:hypothetical protein [Flavobacteriaceae bacterium]
MSDYRKQLYGKIKENFQGFNVPYEQFEKDMQDTTKLQRLYGNLQNKKLIGSDVGYEDFATNMTAEPKWVSDLAKQNREYDLLQQAGTSLQNRKLSKEEQIEAEQNLNRSAGTNDKEMLEYAKTLKDNRPKYFDWNNKEAIKLYDNVRSKRDALGKELEDLNMLSHDYQEKALAYDLLDQAERAMSADKEDKGFFSGVGDTAMKRDTYTLGASDLQLGGYLYALSRKFDDNGNLQKGEELTEADKLLLEAVYVNDEAQSKSQHGLGYTVGSGAMASVPFMVQFMATAGVGSAAAKGAGKLLIKGAKRFLKKGIKSKMATKAVRTGAMTANAMARSALAPTTFSGTMKDMAGEVRSDEQGHISFDPETQKEFFPALYDNYTSNVAENFSEVLGGEVITKFIKGLGTKALTKTLGEEGVKALAKQKPAQIVKGLLTGFDNKWLQKAGFNGYLPEVAEEYVVAPLTDLLHGEFKEVKNWGSWRTHAEIWLTTAVITGAMGGGHLATDGAKRIGYKRKLNRVITNSEAELLKFSSKEELESLRTALENGNVEKIGQSLDVFYNGINEFSEEQKREVLKYAHLKMQKLGIEGGLQQKVEEAFNREAEQINELATDNGQLIKAKYLNNKDSEVFVVGNPRIELNEDGTLNRGNSDKEIVILDAVSGERKLIPIDHLSEFELDEVEATKKRMYEQMLSQAQMQSEMEGQEEPFMNGDKVVAELNGVKEQGEITNVDALTGQVTVLFGDPVNGKRNVLYSSC